ncbi:MAG TPA: hypothetical protein VJX67_12760 [Blastocatellia bacterium]|nr:hypothetical protein [Blastocatellia bacterium]
MAFLGDIEASSILLRQGGTDGPVQIQLLTPVDDANLGGTGTAAAVKIGGNGAGGTVSIADSNSQTNIVLDATSGNVNIGGNGTDGTIFIEDSSSRANIVLDATRCDVTIGGEGADGTLSIADSRSNPNIVLDATRCDVTIGGSGADGTVSIANSFGIPWIVLDGQEGTIKGSTINIADGKSLSKVVLTTYGEIDLLGQAAAGLISVRGSNDSPNIELDALNCMVTIGGTGRMGVLVSPTVAAMPISCSMPRTATLA